MDRFCIIDVFVFYAVFYAVGNYVFFSTVISVQRLSTVSSINHLIRRRVLGQYRSVVIEILLVNDNRIKSRY